ncbi:MAG TPA: inositol monophosphatase family protein [Gemmatimonadaceae bacterium]|nr:inositol monophosphatase family protein [Gemmatimonadaceae bacterium]
MNQPDEGALLDAMVAAARAAGGIISAAAPTASDLAWEEKTAFDFVSRVDRAAEEEIVRILSAAHPDWLVLGEELTPAQQTDSGRAFIVDPLDGTTNFLHGYPEYAVSIAASAEGELLAAAVLNVGTGELFTAIAGGGAWLDGVPITVSRTTDHTRALIGTGFPFRRLDELARYVRQFDLVARRTSGIRRVGSAVLDLSDVACGRFDAFWELSLSPWDVAAGLLLIREAGGVVTDLEGSPARPAFGGYVAGNPVMHAWLMQTLADAEGD